MSFLQPKAVAGRSGAGVPRNVLYWEGDLFGNNNYQSTGDVYSAAAFGMSGFSMVNIGDRSNSGNFSAAAIFPANASSSNETYAPASNNFALHVYSANGTEVANNNNLASEIFRVQIWGL